LVVEMWGLLKALATQLHVNVELAAPSSSSTATEPSPVQGNRCKDKAPESLEDSNDDNKDISKSVLGGKSLSLAQGSGALLYNIGLLDPRAKSLSNLYEDIVRAVKKVSIGTHCTFPSNNNVGFSKEDLLHVSMLCKQFKALCTALQLCVGLAEDGSMLVDIYSIIVTILYTMRLLDAIALAHASTTNRSTNRDSANWNYGKQSSKKKDASPAYPNKPYPKKKGTGTAPSTKFN